MLTQNNTQHPPTRGRRYNLWLRLLPMVLTAAAMAAGTAVFMFGIAPGSGRPAGATGGNTISSPDTGGDVGKWTSLALDSRSSPVISYYDGTNGDLKVLHCNDPDCRGGDDSIAAPDAAGNVGLFTSLALYGNNPLVSYKGPGGLRVLHCGNSTCTAANSIQVPGTDLDDGVDTSLAFDATGNPAISNMGTLGHTFPDYVKVLHCDDPNCAGDESAHIAAPDTVSLSRGTSVLLDNLGNPVVSYSDFRANVGDLKVLHCDDPNCAGDESTHIATPDGLGLVGSDSSLALQSSGNPVVSYYDLSNGDLKVLYCGNPNCTTNNTITTVDQRGDVGQYTSLELQADGNPVVSYYDATNGDLKILHCGNPFCSAGNTIASPDTAGNVGQYTSLELDASGNPVVSYYDVTNRDLKLLHCADKTCKAGVGDNGSPVVSACPDMQVRLGQPASCTASFTDTGGGAHTCRFDWGNGTVRSRPVTQNPAGTSGTCSDTYTYPVAGTYTVEVCVTDAKSQEGCDEFQVRVDGPPVVNADGCATKVTLGQPVSCTASFTDDGGAHTCRFTWADGTISQLPVTQNAAGTSGSCSGSHTYAAAGTYLAQACVNDGKKTGCDQFQVRVNSQPIPANATIPPGMIPKRFNCTGPPSIFGRADYDCDGLPDLLEQALNAIFPGICLDWQDWDSDNDRVSDGAEFYLRTNPCNRDTDRDGIWDGDEIFHRAASGFGCLSPLNPDSDGDGVGDGVEAFIGINPCQRDTDGDALTDGGELYIAALFRGSCPDPRNPDSDNDGATLVNNTKVWLVDGAELYLRWNPCDAQSPGPPRK